MLRPFPLFSNDLQFKILIAELVNVDKKQYPSPLFVVDRQLESTILLELIIEIPLFVVDKPLSVTIQSRITQLAMVSTLIPSPSQPPIIRLVKKIVSQLVSISTPLPITSLIFILLIKPLVTNVLISIPLPVKSRMVPS